MKSSIKTTIRIICFLAGLLVIVFYLNNILIKKDAEAKYGYFYDEAQEYDVLFVGISHLQVAVSPLELWKDYGIASFNLSHAGSRLPSSYWVLKNALQYCDPKLVVIDVRRINDNKYNPDLNKHTQYDKMPFGLLKAEAVMDLFDSWQDRVEMLIPFTIYHNRWVELTRNDFKTEDVNINKGSTDFDTRVRAYVPEEFTILPETEKSEGGALAVEYLEKMIQMCQDRGIEVLLINAPYVAVSEKLQRSENGAADIASKFHINYLNFLHVEDIVNFQTDMHDPGHLNPSGMNKVTEYLGAYLKQNYDIPDRREDAAYGSWDRTYEEFSDYKFDKMGNIDAADSSLVLLADKNIDCCVYVKAGTPLLTDLRYRELIQNVTLGVALTRLQEAADQGKDYVLIVDRDQNAVMEYVGNDAPVCAKTSFGDVCFGLDDGGSPFLRIGSSETNYIAGGADIRTIAIDAGTGTVKNTGGFSMATERAE